MSASCLAVPESLLNKGCMTSSRDLWDGLGVSLGVWRGPWGHLGSGFLDVSGGHPGVPESDVMYAFGCHHVSEGSLLAPKVARGQQVVNKESIPGGGRPQPLAEARSDDNKQRLRVTESHWRCPWTLRGAWKFLGASWGVLPGLLAVLESSMGIP